MDNLCWEAEIERLREEKYAAIERQDFNAAADLRDLERRYVMKLREADEARARVCPTEDCPGDGRYGAPGRGHREDCTFPLS